MTDHHEATATLEPIGLSFVAKSVDFTLDEGWSPYCQARFTCVLPEGADRTAIDLRTTELRLTGQLRQDFGETFSLATITSEIGSALSDITAFLGGENLGKITRTFYTPWNGASIRASGRRPFDLYVTEREFDDNNGELTLLAQSDEARLHGDRLVATTAWNPNTVSLREIAQLVLDRYDAALAEDAEDATVAEVNATIWQPGKSAWDYLNPMLEAASLRLWCSELGVWTITERQATVDGAVSLTPSGTMTGHRDKMTLDPDVWADAVIIEYRWTDDLDLAQVAYDAAGETNPRAALFIERRDTIYPGAGAAAGMLNRIQGRGRVLDVTAISDYSLSPGMAATITPPDTSAQTGYLASVTWKLPDAEVDAATRGLVDTPATAYLYGAAGKKYTDVPVGMDYTEFDWSLI